MFKERRNFPRYNFNRYARIQVEEGAEISGEISVLEKTPSGALPKRTSLN